MPQGGPYGCHGCRSPPLGTDFCTLWVGRAATARMLQGWSVYAALVERLAQDLTDMAAARRPCIQQENPVVRPRHLARHRHLPAADQAGLRDGVVRGAKRPGGHQGRARAQEAERCDECAWSRWPRPGSAPAGWWSAAAPASTCPPQAGPASGNYGQKASRDFRCTLGRCRTTTTILLPRSGLVFPGARPRTSGSSHTRRYGRGYCRASNPPPCSASS
jgi:hypothetical protein